MPSKKEQKRLAKKRQKEVERLIKLERVDCSWYPDDCEYCRNCNFEWLKLTEKSLW